MPTFQAPKLAARQAPRQALPSTEPVGFQSWRNTNDELCKRGDDQCFMMSPQPHNTEDPPPESTLRTIGRGLTVLLSLCQLLGSVLSLMGASNVYHEMYQYKWNGMPDIMPHTDGSHEPSARGRAGWVNITRGYLITGFESFIMLALNIFSTSVYNSCCTLHAERLEFERKLNELPMAETKARDALKSKFESKQRRARYVSIESQPMDLTRQFFYGVGDILVAVGGALVVADYPSYESNTMLALWSATATQTHSGKNVYMTTELSDSDKSRWFLQSWATHSYMVDILFVAAWVRMVGVIVQFLTSEGVNVFYWFPFARCGREWFDASEAPPTATGESDESEPAAVPRKLRGYLTCLPSDPNDPTRRRKVQCESKACHVFASLGHNIFGAFRVHIYPATACFLIAIYCFRWATTAPNTACPSAVMPIVLASQEAKGSAATHYVVQEVHGSRRRRNLGLAVGAPPAPSPASSSGSPSTPQVASIEGVGERCFWPVVIPWGGCEPETNCYPESKAARNPHITSRNDATYYLWVMSQLLIASEVLRVVSAIAYFIGHGVGESSIPGSHVPTTNAFIDCMCP